MIRRWHMLLLSSLALAFLATVIPAAETKFPPASELPAQTKLPDPLVMFDGRPVKTAEQWRAERRPELRALFQHYMYGQFPDTVPVRAKVEQTDDQYFGGTATKKLVTIHYGPNKTPPIQLLLVVPNRRTSPAPVFVGMNFCGNHTLVDDATIPLPRVWMPERCPGCQGNVASDEGRGKQIDVWNLQRVIARGYAVATFYSGDVDPDKPDFSDGVHPHFLKAGQTQPGQHDWGTIAAWSYGIHRVVDYLVSDADLDKGRIAVVGHSRLGKTALLAAAFDDRIAMAIPLQAGCGGTAPSRGKVGESVKAINDRFPHWFCDEFTRFNDHPERLPFDQHCLVALVAPRPVLFSNAVEDSWANPDGQFEMLRAADSVYRLLGVEGLSSSEPPAIGKLLDSRLGYFIRPGKHSMSAQDWDAFCDFADKHFKKP